MARSKAFTRLVISPMLGIIFATAGCGGGTTAVESNPEAEAQRQQARVSAYGAKGYQSDKGSGGGMTAQAAARRRNGGH